MIACYARVSTSEQAENGHSIGEQQDRMVKYCDAMGWKHHKLYTDAGFSGATISRPAMQQLIKDVKAGKIEKVLVYKLDRLSRSQKDTLYLIEDIFLSHDCDFVSMSENFDTSSPFGRAMIGILAVFAQLEREQIKERMIMGKQARAKSGKFNGSSCPPIGYDYINGELVINDFEAVQIRKIFEWFASGVPVLKITDRLNDAGYEHKYGKWSVVSVRRALTRQTYIGMSYSKGKWYQGIHEPILDREVFDKVQSIVEHTHQMMVAHGRRCGVSTSYLGGYIYCARCGNRFSKKSTDHGAHEYYICNTRSQRRFLEKGMTCDNPSWRMKDLDDLVFSEIKKLTLEDFSTESHADNRSQVIANRLTELDKQMERLIDLYADGKLPVGKIQAKITALNDQKSKLETELENIDKETRESLQPSEALKLIETLDDVVQNADYDGIRAVISALIDHIDIDGDDITIYWNFY